MTAGDVWGDPSETPALAAALEAHAVGLAVLPPREDGSKAPDVASWTKFQAERPSETQLRAWYAKGRTGVGVICGLVSGIEMIEIEGRGVAEGVDRHFRELCEAAGLGEVLDRVLRGYTERTPSGGLHIIYRVPTPKGNTKLARRPATADELAEKPDDPIRVLVESRGEGGFVVTAPSSGGVHPTGRPWTLEVGGFASIASITDAERDELWQVAQTLDAMPIEAPRVSARNVVNGEDRPGDRYNAQPDVQDRVVALLEAHGWAHVAQRGEIDYMRRPGKDVGISATVGFAGAGVVHVFSTSVAGLEPGRSHSPFTVLTHLEHGGDPRAAAAAIEPPAALTLRSLTPQAAGIPRGKLQSGADGPGIAARLGARSLLDVPAVAPRPLLIDRIDPDGHTILYGAGGTGKGTLAASWCAGLAYAGHRVLILDYENHPAEWARRVAGLGGDEARERITHVAPLTAEWTGERGPIWQTAGLIRELADAVSADVVLVDSIVVACAGFDPMKPETPALYASGLELIGRPTLSLAHVTKTEDLRFPFGSAFFANLARTTWSLKTDGDRAILTHRKRNNYASLGRYVVTVTWRDDLPREIWEQPYTQVLAERIGDALGDESLTAAQVVARLNTDRTDDEEEIKADSVKKALIRGLRESAREPQRFTIAGSGATATYRRIRP